jgi:hypothetical protein
VDDSYFPFDFGAWSASEDAPPMICSRHGLQEGGLLIKITPRRGQPAISRKFCGLCVLDTLDKIPGELTDG